jgi:transcriptional regulator with XRE-family HTH domain
MTVYEDRLRKIQELKSTPKVKKMIARVQDSPRFAEQLRAEMKRSGVSLMELCSATGISFDTMTRYRSLTKPMEPTRAKLLMIRDAIGCPLSRLTTGPTPPQKDRRVNRHGH